MKRIDSAGCEDSRAAVSSLPDPRGDPSLLTLGLRGLLLEPESVFTDHTLLNAVRHVAGCPACQLWLDTLDPVWAMAKEREALYCCTRMYSAALSAENPDLEQPQTGIAFARDREGCGIWVVNGSATDARFCMWCGAHLPPDGFEHGVR